jgi:parallel beta-helix repeat protein
MKFVEQIDSLTIDNCWIARHINFDSTPKDVTITNCRFGDMPWESRGLFNTISFTGGTHHNPQSHIFDLNVSGTAIIRNCDFYGFTIAGIDLNGRSQDYSPTGYSTLVIENCNFGGSGASVAPIQVTDGGLINSSRRFIYKNNTVNNFQNGGVTVYCMSGSTAINTYNRLFQQANDSANEYFHSSAPTSPNISWQVGDRILNTGTQNLGGNIGWICIASGAPGTWVTYGDLGNKLQQSYLTGVYDVTYYGVTNTGEDVTIALQSFFNNVPDNSKVRIPGGIYRINDSIKLYRKRNLSINAENAVFLETRRLPSGTFLISGSVDLTWNGGEISGADTLSFILGFASGVEFSGLGIENFGPGFDLDGSVRYVLGQVFDTHTCSGIKISNVFAHDKYRFFCDNNGKDITVCDINHIGLHTGNLNRSNPNTVFGITGAFPNTGTASALLGAIYKETARTTYTITANKTNFLLVQNIRSKNTGGFLVAGSVSLGGPGGNPQYLTITDSFGRNMYDNGIYLSSVNKAFVSNIQIVNDSTLEHAIAGIKGRGSDIIFTNCYVERALDGFGFEGIGSVSDYWTTGSDAGWAGRGCRLTNSTARDIRNAGVYLDRNNNIYPRDTLIANNYFFDCAKGPYGGDPTGYNNDAVTPTVIRAVDGMRCQILNNTVECTGIFGPDYAIYVGAYYSTATITGCNVSNNIILGAKQGIYLNDVAYARVKNNYGERIGLYGAPYVIASGYPALIVTNDMVNSIISENMVVTTGSAAVLYVNPDTIFSNVIRKDNIGYEVIN